MHETEDVHLQLVSAGDITASTTGERVKNAFIYFIAWDNFIYIHWRKWQIYCIFLFLGAASVFGTLISQVNEIVNQQTSMSQELDEVLEAYLAIEPKSMSIPASMFLL